MNLGQNWNYFCVFLYDKNELQTRHLVLFMSLVRSQNDFPVQRAPGIIWSSMFDNPTR